jgi:hypothetical protein
VGPSERASKWARERGGNLEDKKKRGRFRKYRKYMKVQMKILEVFDKTFSIL